MLKRTPAALAAVLIGLLILSGCGAPRAKATPTPDANTVYTQVAATFIFRATSEAALTPSVTPTLHASATPAVTATRTATPATPTKAASATRTGVPDGAVMVSQSIPDNSRFTPGAPITVVWTMKNVGETTWGEGYTLKFFSGDQMGAPSTIPLPKEVKPQDTVEITVNFTAPSQIGPKTSYWVLQNAAGVNFYPMWIEIEITSDVPAPSVPAPTETATTASTGG